MTTTPKKERTPRPSRKTRPVRFRLLNDVYDILERRAKYHPYGKAGYVRDRMTYDLTRKHQRSRER